jgi:hypothetical protein
VHSGVSGLQESPSPLHSPPGLALEPLNSDYGEDKAPNYLLTLVAVACIIGVSSAAIRAARMQYLARRR